MNRKQLRRAICGSAVILTLGGGLLSQASGEGGLISRLWDKRPRLSESRLNPRNWFGDDSNDAVADADLKPVVSVRPELTRNPFGGESSFADTDRVAAGAATSEPAVAAAVREKQPAAVSEQKRATEKRAASLPVIAPATTHAQKTAGVDEPPPGLDALFRRPSREMIEQARRRKQGGSSVASTKTAVTAPKAADQVVGKAASSVADREPATTEVASRNVATTEKPAPRRTLLRRPTSARQERQSVEPPTGRVAVRSLESDEAETGLRSGFVRLSDSDARLTAQGRETGSEDQTADGAESRSGFEPTLSESDATFDRLMAEIQATSGNARSTAARSLSAPRLPDGLNVSLSSDSAVARNSTTSLDGTNDVASDSSRTSVADAAPAEGNSSGTAGAPPQTEPGDGVPEDAQSRSIDELIARTRAEMNGTLLARQVEQERERESVVRDEAIETRVDQVSVSQPGPVDLVTAPPLMVPQGFHTGSFRTYGEATTADERSAQTFPPAMRTPSADSTDELDRRMGSQSRLSRIEQAARSAQQRTQGPEIVPGPAGSGVVIDGTQYSAVKPKVTSNAAPSLSVPDRAEFRRLSYERRASELAGQVERLADGGPTQPLLIMPGEPLPQQTMEVDSRQETVAADEAAASVGSPIDWPDDEDLAPVKPKSGGTSWGLIIFCLALLTAGSHIAVSRFRQSRTAAAAVKS